MTYQMKSSPAKLMGAIKVGKTLVKYGKKAYNAIKGTKPKVKTKTSRTQHNTKANTTTTINKTNGKTTSEVTRNSWPNVKPGTTSTFPGTSTNASGKVTAFDPTKRQILNSNAGVKNSLSNQLKGKVKRN